MQARLTDVSQDDQAEAAVADCVQHLGRLDIIVNAATFITGSDFRIEGGLRAALGVR